MEVGSWGCQLVAKYSIWRTVCILHVCIYTQERELGFELHHSREVCT